MNFTEKKLVEISILIISGDKETEVTLGIGTPENARCHAYIDGFEEPRRKTGLSDWEAFFRALSWLSVRLQELERCGYRFAVLDCDPPRHTTALELMHGMTYVQSTQS
ncbi:MAG TPA: hypothetical protein V6C97_15380 [Oculatellaceae cyanobacterium]